MFKPKGIISSVVTPFKQNGDIDEAAFKELLLFQIKNNVEGLAVTGNTGEFTDLTVNEVKHITDITMDTVGGKTRVVVGALSPSMRDNMEIVKHAKEAGADATLVTPPYYIAPPEDGLFQYFETIGNIGMPMIIFNHPDRTPYNLMPKMIERLITIDTVVGIKECDAMMTRVYKKILAIDGRISYLMGYMTLAFYHFLLGGDGGFFSACNYAPKLLQDLYKETKAGNVEKALDLHKKVCILNDGLQSANYPASVKEAVNLVGLNGGYCRAPIGGMTESEKKNLENALRTIGVLK